MCLANANGEAGEKSRRAQPSASVASQAAGRNYLEKHDLQIRARRSGKKRRHARTKLAAFRPKRSLLWTLTRIVLRNAVRRGQKQFQVTALFRAG